MSEKCLVPPIPHQWKGLFTTLEANKPLHHAENWIQKEMAACYGEHVSSQWQTLLQYLSDVVIVLEGCKEIKLVCVHSYLPFVVQRNLLAVIYQHRADIDKDVLRHFVETVDHGDKSLTWTSLLWKLLSNYIGISPTENTSSDLPAKAKVEPLRQMKPPKSREDIGGEMAPNSPGELSMEILESDMAGEMESHDETRRGPVEEDCIIILDEDDEHSEGTTSPPTKRVKVEESAVTEDHTMLYRHDETCELEKELLEKGREFRELLHGSPDDDLSLTESLKILLQTSPDKILALSRACGLDDLPETELEAASGALVKMSDTISYSSCVALISGLMTYKLELLDHTASRLVQGVVISLAETFPLQLVDAVVVPSLVQNLGTPHSELLCRLCKDCLSKSHQAHLIRKLVQGNTVLTDSALSVVHNVLEAKPDLDEGIHTAILDCLSGSAEAFTNSLKFGKLLLSFVNKYVKQWTRIQISTMSQISGRHKTFLHSKIHSALKKTAS